MSGHPPSAGARCGVPPCALRPPARARRAVTLLELLVVLALLGLAAGVVLPALRPAGTGPSDRVAAVVARARAQAQARGEALVLVVTGDGTWTLGVADEEAPLLASGQAAGAPRVPWALRLTPRGACLPITALPPPLVPWDVAACAADGAGAR